MVIIYSIGRRISYWKLFFMKFNLKKTGFTLGETLIVLLIIIILTIFSIITMRSRSNTTPLLYYRAYEALNTAVYNAWLEAGDNDDKFADKNGTKYSSDLAALCIQLAGANGYINNDGKNLDPVTKNPTSCDRPGIAIPTSTANEAFTESNAHFTSSNSMRFFISRELSGSIPLSNYVTDTVSNTAINPKWYIIFVDLDGEKGLNSMAQPANQNNTADVVAFALIIDPDEMPSLIPIGVPTMDKRYMTAMVKYTNAANGNDRKSPSLPYKEAAIRAYGAQSPKGGAKVVVPERIYFENFIGTSNKLFYAALPAGITTDCNCEHCNNTSNSAQCRTECLKWCPVPKTNPNDTFGVVNPGCEPSQIGACSVIVNSYTGTSKR